MIEEYDFRGESDKTVDKEYEIALRPKQFEDFSGQDGIVQNLKIFVAAAKMRKMGWSDGQSLGASVVRQPLTVNSHLT